MADKYETDIMVWEDPDVDAIVIENIGGIQFAGDNMLCVVNDKEEIIFAFNKNGWYRFEIVKRLTTGA